MVTESDKALEAHTEIPTEKQPIEEEIQAAEAPKALEAPEAPKPSEEEKETSEAEESSKSIDFYDSFMKKQFASEIRCSAPQLRHFSTQLPAPY